MFSGSLPDLLNIFYKHDGEYYFYGTTMLNVALPASDRLAFVIGGQHDIFWSRPEDVPQGAVSAGHITYDLPNRRIAEAEGLGKYIQMLYESAVNKWKDVASSTIGPAETTSHEIDIDSPVSDAIFALKWQGSDLDLVLYTPGNEIIDPDVAAVDPDVDYDKGPGYAYYRVHSPTTGAWRAQVIARDVPQAGEEYTIVLGSATTTAPGVPGDADGNGRVDILDLVLVSLSFNIAPGDPRADLNADGIVNIFDLALVGLNFGRETQGP